MRVDHSWPRYAWNDNDQMVTLFGSFPHPALDLSCNIDGVDAPADTVHTASDAVVCNVDATNSATRALISLEVCASSTNGDIATGKIHNLTVFLHWRSVHDF